MSKPIDINEPCLIIAEAGVNHNGSERMAFELVDAAIAAGADAVKFQTFNAETLVTRIAKKASYQETQTGEGSQFAMLKELELPATTYRRLADYCVKKDIEFLSTPFDEESANFLIELGCQRLKVASGELTNTPFLYFLATKGLPIILSTGMAELKEVSEAVSVIEAVQGELGLAGLSSDPLTLLHCTSSYPTLLPDVNLRAMQTLASQFGLPVGYSDHTSGIKVAPVARALGAKVFEKHFTLDRKLRGPDHAASLNPSELAEMIRAIRDTESLLGSDEKTPTPAELEVRSAVRRSVTLARDVNAGTPLSYADLVLMRPGDGIPPNRLEAIVGRCLKQDLVAGTTLYWDTVD